MRLNFQFRYKSTTLIFIALTRCRLLLSVATRVPAVSSIAGILSSISTAKGRVYVDYILQKRFLAISNVINMT